LEVKVFSHLYSHATRQRLVSLEKVAYAIAGRDAVIESREAAEKVIERAIAVGQPGLQAVVKWRIFDKVQYDNLCAWSWGNKRARATRWGQKHLTGVDEDGQLYANGVEGRRIYPTAAVTSVRPLRKSGKSKRDTAAGTSANPPLYSTARRTTIPVPTVEGMDGRVSARGPQSGGGPQ
jgi:hypothetical protein